MLYVNCNGLVRILHVDLGKTKTKEVAKINLFIAWDSDYEKGKPIRERKSNKLNVIVYGKYAEAMTEVLSKLPKNGVGYLCDFTGHLEVSNDQYEDAEGKYWAMKGHILGRSISPVKSPEELKKEAASESQTPRRRQGKPVEAPEDAASAFAKA